MLCFRWLGCLPETQGIIKKEQQVNQQKCIRPSAMSEPGKHNKNITLDNWSDKNMQAAFNEYKAQNGKVSVRQLSPAWQVPRSTLQMRLHGNISGSSHVSGRKAVFEAKTETDLVDVIKDLSKRGFPLGTKEVRSIAFSYALQHGIDGFSASNKLAGYEWLKSF